jgi:hypothetical protein
MAIDPHNVFQSLSYGTAQKVASFAGKPDTAVRRSVTIQNGLNVMNKLHLLAVAIACHVLLVRPMTAADPPSPKAASTTDPAQEVAAAIRKHLAITPVHLDSLLRQRLSEVEYDRSSSVEALEKMQARLKAVRAEHNENERKLKAATPQSDNALIEATKTKLHRNRIYIADAVTIGTSFERAAPWVAIEITMLRAVLNGNREAFDSEKKKSSRKPSRTAVKHKRPDQPITLEEWRQRQAALYAQVFPDVARLSAFHKRYPSTELPISTKHGDQRFLKLVCARAGVAETDADLAISKILQRYCNTANAESFRLETSATELLGDIMQIEGESKAIRDERVKAEDGSLKRAQDDITHRFEQLKKGWVNAHLQIPRAKSHVIQCCILARLVEGEVEPGLANPKRLAKTERAAAKSMPALVKVDPADAQLMDKAEKLLERWPKIVARYKSLRAESVVPPPKPAVSP